MYKVVSTHQSRTTAFRLKFSKSTRYEYFLIAFNFKFLDVNTELGNRY